MRQRDDRAPAPSSSPSASLPPSAAASQHSHRHRATFAATTTDMYAQLLSESQFREATATASATAAAGDASALTAADASTGTSADDSARQRYAEYRTECERRRARSFFDAHRTHDWFRRCFDAAARAGAELGAGADAGTVLACEGIDQPAKNTLPVLQRPFGFLQHHNKLLNIRVAYQQTICSFQM